MQLIPSSDFLKLHAANVTAGSITDPVPTTTAPSGDGVFSGTPDGVSGDCVFTSVCLVFSGTRAAGANETFQAKVYGWRKLGSVWIPIFLASLRATLGPVVGVSGTELSDDEYLADRLTLLNSHSNPWVPSIDQGMAVALPGSEASAGSFTFDLAGYALAEVRLATETNASCNVFAAGF